MSSVIVAGDTSGSVTLQAPAEAGTTVLTLPTTSGTVQVSGSAGSFTSLTDSGLTSGRVTYASTGGLLADSANLTFNGTSLGVGTASPTAPLTVVTNSSAQGFSILGRSSDNFAIQRFLSNNGSSNYATLYSSGANNLIIETGGAERMRIDSAGNTGIGTASPASKLDVADTFRVTYSTSSVYYGSITNPNGNTYFYANGDSASLIFGSTVVGGTTATERMRLDSSGNLGLGVTPSAWQSGAKAVEVGFVGNCIESGSTNTISYGQNTYLNSGWKYANTGVAASRFDISGGSYVWNIAPSGTAGNAITFTQAMTLDASGNLLVRTTTASGKLAVSNNTNQTIAYLNADSGAYTADALYIQVATTSTNQYNFINCTRSGVAVKFLVKDTGNVQNANNSYGAISDIKLKENIVDTSPKLDKLLQVKIRNYNLKTEPDQKQIGVIAQELETIFPSLIEESEDKEKVTKTREVEVPAVDEVLDEEGNVVTPAVEATTKTEEYTEDVLTGETTKSVKYSVFVPILIKAMQEQQAMIDELKAKVAALEAA